MTAELQNVRAAKDALNAWADTAMNTLKDIQSRPGRLRSDAADLELNQLQNMRDVSAHLSLPSFLSGSCLTTT